MRLFLIGFMGSGKSKIGKLLSKKLNIKHIDLDDFIEKSENKSISEIFKNYGENQFRKIEEKYLREIIIDKNIVISTGGGTPTINNLMDLMNELGETIYLKCYNDILFQRIQIDKEKRPIISQIENKDLRAFIDERLNKREIFYKKSKHTICNNKGNPIKNIIDSLG